MSHSLKELVLAVVDPRAPHLVQYPLSEILFMSITAVICGANGPSDIAAFGSSCQSWLRRHYPFEQGMPSHDTINRTLGLIGVRQFERVFFEWVKQNFALPDELQIAIDGKKISRSAKKAAQQLKKELGGSSAELIINAYVPGLCIALGQANEGKSQSEVAGARKLIELFDLQGACVSADAGFLGKDLIQEIVDKKGEYLITLKAKSPKVHTAVARAFTEQDARRTVAELPVDIEHGHGRTSHRQFSTIQVEQIEDEYARTFYAKARQIIRVKRLHQVDGKQPKITTHYYITSLDTDLEHLKETIRAHWSVENNLHHTLDVVFKEDDLVAQVNNLSNNLSLIRKVALNLLTAHHGTIGTKRRRFTAGLNEDVRNTLIKPMMR